MQKPGKLYKKLIKYAAAAIMVAVPLYPKFPFINVPGTFVAIRFEDFLIALAGLLIAPLLLRDIKKLIANDLVRAILLYLSIGLISVFTAVYVLSTVSASLGFLHWLRRIEYLIPFFVGYYAIKMNKNSYQFYIKLLIVIIIALFIYGYGQKNYSWPIIITQNFEYSQGVALRYIPGAHINSTFAGHYDLAAYLVLVLPFIVILFSTTKAFSGKIFYLVIWLLGLWLLVNTASRISLVAYIGASTMSLILVRKYRYIFVMLVVSILFINFSSNLIARYTTIFEVAINKISYQIDSGISVYAQGSGLPERRERPEPTPTSVPRFEDRSTNIRLDVEWPRAIRALKKNPLLGTGYSSITLATDNHYLRLLGETGVFGFFAFMLIKYRIFTRYFCKYPFKKADRLARYFVIGLIGGSAGILVNATFIDVFEASKFAISFWLFTGMALSLIRHKDEKSFI